MNFYDKHLASDTGDLSLSELDDCVRFAQSISMIMQLYNDIVHCSGIKVNFSLSSNFSPQFFPLNGVKTSSACKVAQKRVISFK